MAANTTIQRATQTQSAPPTGGRELIIAQINQMQSAVKRALPSVMTPERFTRIAVSALSTTPKLAECHPMTFIGAMMTAAQLGLEPNTPPGAGVSYPLLERQNKAPGMPVPAWLQGYDRPCLSFRAKQLHPGTCGL